MDQERLLALVEETNRLTKQNTLELTKIRKRLLMASVLRIIAWLILAGVPVFVYLHLVKPPLERVFGN